MKGRIRQPRSRNDLFDGREAAARQERSEGPLRRGPEDEPAPRRIRRRQNWSWSVRGATKAYGMGRKPSLDAAYSCYASSCRKPPRYVSMPGGVGGGARESSSYPICGSHWIARTMLSIQPGGRKTSVSISPPLGWICWRERQTTPLSVSTQKLSTKDQSGLWLRQASSTLFVATV
jgi:hypothetical protein